MEEEKGRGDKQREVNSEEVEGESATDQKIDWSILKNYENYNNKSVYIANLADRQCNVQLPKYRCEQ